MQRSEEWQQQRRGKLTASNLGAALGQVTYVSRLQAYRRAVGTDTFTGNAATNWGIAHEPMALRAYSTHTGYEVIATGLHQHPTLEWCAGSPDGLVGADGIVEVKCPYYQQTKGPHQSIPLHYYLQMQQLLQCTSRQWCDYVCYCGAHGMSLFRVLRDDILFEDLMGDMQKFATSVRLKTGKPPRVNKRRISERVRESMRHYVDKTASNVPCLLIVD